MSGKNNTHQVGCLDKHAQGNDHELQLWIEPREGGFCFVVRSAYVPGGKQVRRCELDSGSILADYDEVLKLGRAAFERQK
ncbi:MAG: hypothetical protein K2Z81_01570 [Cyanobacteria bacterium]|nr:hypothetical protein [Cyanobacteriota bacterium]